MSLSNFEAVIGLEVHVELRTRTKIFCGCSTAFGAPPNTLCCPVCLGLPGAMPRLNRQAVVLAVKAGLALDCEIERLSRTDRKQYFYPDLPKAYQISQDALPLCRGGSLAVRTSEGEKKVGIRRIHIEEDAGKLIHTGNTTLVDCNRCGVPLAEIVTEPDMTSPEQAGAFLRTLRDILVTCGVSDCRMHEGSMRCDVNVSLIRPGESRTGGVRCEIKNINSFAFVEKAIAYELRRQHDILLSGGILSNETRRYDAARGVTERMRKKERAADYRYLAEPDLPSLAITDLEIEALRRTLPELPRARAARLCADYGIAPADADILVGDPALADFFEAAAGLTEHRTVLTGLVLSELLRHCKTDPFACPIPPAAMAELAALAGEGTVNSSIAKRLLVRLMEQPDLELRATVAQEHLAQLRDPHELAALIEAVLADDPRAAADYRAGKKNAANALLGKAMKRSGGRAEPHLLEQLLKEALER